MFVRGPVLGLWERKNTRELEADRVGLVTEFTEGFIPLWSPGVEVGLGRDRRSGDVSDPLDHHRGPRRVWW